MALVPSALELLSYFSKMEPLSSVGTEGVLSPWPPFQRRKAEAPGAQPGTQHSLPGALNPSFSY